jgi:hypothetical protein
VVDLDPPAVPALDSALEGQPRDAGDRRQRLAPESEAGHPVENVVGQLRGGVTFQREPHFVWNHAASVIGDLDHLEAARGQPDPDRCGPGIQSILNKLLEGARRALYDLASGDAIHEL